MWVWSEERQRIVLAPTTFVPGLYKIFDEILVNAADNKQRDPKGMTALKVTVNAAANTISVWNNGE
jgi:DNA topoisomerase-2